MSSVYLMTSLKKEIYFIVIQCCCPAMLKSVTHAIVRIKSTYRFLPFLLDNGKHMSVMFSLNKKSEKPHGESKQLLSLGKTPLQIPQRPTMTEANSIRISMENPLADYKALIDEMMDSNEDDDEQTKYKLIAAEARKTVWNLLFTESTPENQKKASDLLKEHKMDACFYIPWDYNDWIVGVRDELLKREMFDFWHNVIVKESLGPCWARDSDYFDDMEDPEPAQFYHHAGAVAPWESSEKEVSNEVEEEDNSILPPAETNVASPRNIPTNHDLKISSEDPLNEYRQIVEKYLTKNTSLNDDEIEEVYKSIAESACKTVWSLLFDDPQPPSADLQNKAGDLLHEHKSNACFYAPWVYNEWIVKLRDEVLKRELFDFWRDHMVKRELGLCWAKDSDYFDDMEDPKPVEFYKHAGCEAPWIK